VTSLARNQHVRWSASGHHVTLSGGSPVRDRPGLRLGQELKSDAGIEDETSPILEGESE
jgi:hypothetical protein